MGYYNDATYNREVSIEESPRHTITVVVTEGHSIRRRPDFTVDGDNWIAALRYKFDQLIEQIIDDLAVEVGNDDIDTTG